MLFSTYYRKYQEIEGQKYNKKRCNRKGAFVPGRVFFRIVQGVKDVSDHFNEKKTGRGKIPVI